MLIKKPKRLPKTSSIRWWIKQADKEMSLLVRSTGHCQRCGSVNMLQHAHIIPRTNFTLRYSILNGLCLCYGCHIMFAHKDPLQFVEWLDTTFPDRMSYLRDRRNVITKRTIDDIKEIIKNIKERNLHALK